MSIEYRIGDVFDRLAEIPDGSIDLIVTSPPFLALRSYLPADHPDKHREIGSEPTPADFLDTLYALSAEWGRVLAPHGSLCVELGDTYAGSGGAGGDYKAGGMRDGQGQFDGSSRRERASTHKYAGEWANEGYADKFKGGSPGGNGWPLAKSLTGIPTLYPWGLAYGRNLLTGQPHDAGQWRIRNVIVWARPNPPVGALGDKFRPATSYITVACKGAKRYFDLDAVRTGAITAGRTLGAPDGGTKQNGTGTEWKVGMPRVENPAGAPPLDWHADDHPEDGDWLWKLSTQPYKGSHYATFPLTLPKRLIEAMCPLRVCTVCGRPSERIVEAQPEGTRRVGEALAGKGIAGGDNGNPDKVRFVTSNPTTLGWTDCGCQCGTCDGEPGAQWHVGLPECPDCDTGKHAWRTGIVLDPFAGSGTTLEAAQAVGRHAIGIDLDSRNADLARDRVGMFMEIAS